MPFYFNAYPGKAMKYIRWIIGSFLCLIGLLLPYRIRILYIRLLAILAHAPFQIFGRLARFLLKKLGVKNPYVQ